MPDTLLALRSLHEQMPMYQPLKVLPENAMVAFYIE